MDRPNPLAVGRLTRSELPVATATVSRAFWPDPLFGHFARDPLQEHRLLPVFFGAVLRDAVAHGEVAAVEWSGRLGGAAAWFPPGAMPLDRARRVRRDLSGGRVFLTTRNRRDGIALQQTIDGSHPSEPHWYLALLGVDPAFQGRGLGTALLTPGLARCDDYGVAAYLETQKPENVGYYERLGFSVRDELHVGSCPPLWLMWRDPRP